MTLFKEGGNDSPTSLRRVAAAWFIAPTPVLLGLGFWFLKAVDKTMGWLVFVPGMFTGACGIILLLFTTFSDVIAIIHAVKGEKEQ